MACNRRAVAVVLVFICDHYCKHTMFTCFQFSVKGVLSSSLLQRDLSDIHSSPLQHLVGRCCMELLVFCM